MLLTENVIVIDLEATCWETGQAPPGSYSEILEIGICNLVIGTGEIISKQSIYVIPEQQEISGFCTSLTGITKEMLSEHGITFSQACQKIVSEYEPFGRVWGSYGEFDRSLLQKQCLRENVNFPFGLTHINIKSLFALKMKLKKARGLDKALALIGEPLEGRHHNGSDDAFNAAKILKHILS